MAARAPAPSDQLAEPIRHRSMTPAELAAAASVAPSVLSRFLRGERSLSLATIDRLAPNLGLKLTGSPWRAWQAGGQEGSRMSGASVVRPADDPGGESLLADSDKMMYSDGREKA